MAFICGMARSSQYSWTVELKAFRLNNNRPSIVSLQPLSFAAKLHYSFDIIEGFVLQNFLSLCFHLLEQNIRFTKLLYLSFNPFLCSSFMQKLTGTTNYLIYTTGHLWNILPSLAFLFATTYIPSNYITLMRGAGTRGLATISWPFMGQEVK